MSDRTIQRQRELCVRYGAAFEPPLPGSKVGIALRTVHAFPLNGMRISPGAGGNGWFIWAGEYSEDEDFFDPICHEHLSEYCSAALPFLALPPGWRFLTDGDYVDVWFDPQILTDAPV